MAVAIFRRSLLNGDAEAAEARNRLHAAAIGEELDAALGTAPAPEPDTASISYLISAGTRQIDRRAALLAQTPTPSDPPTSVTTGRLATPEHR